jgi:general secretion pathway protein G
MKPDDDAARATLDYAATSHARPRHRFVRIAGMLVAVSLLFAAAFMAFFQNPLIGVDQPVRIDLNRGKMGALRTPIELYHLHVGTYPDSLDDLTTRPSVADGDQWQGPYVTKLDDLKDRWGRPFRYRAPGIRNPGPYDLWSAGPDGVDGTSDDIGNWKR